MPRVIGIDPGTVSIDLCGLEDGRLFLDRSIPTSDALADPARFVRLLEDAGPVDLVAGPFRARPPPSPRRRAGHRGPGRARAPPPRGGPAARGLAPAALLRWPAPRPRA